MTHGRETEVGGYELTTLLGEGGFGVVYLGKDAKGRLAAVKLLRPGHASDDVRAGLAREVEAARKVSPFCIAQVLDADLYAPQPWIATEYLEGPTLARRVRDGGPLTGAALDRLAVSTATALTAIHRAGILHRDFKPDNIILAPDGPRVIDFGIAKAAEHSQVMASAVVGTPAYMAPEQIDGAALTAKVDVFAWGAVMAYAATGRNAFDGPNVSAVIKRIIMDEPDLEGLTGPLLPVVRRCLAKDRQERYSAHELLNTLLGVEEHGLDTDSALDRGSTMVVGLSSGGEPVGASPYGAVERTRRSGAVPPFEFAGRRFFTPGDLAAAMRDDWAAGAGVFRSTVERGELRAWMIDDVGDTTVNRALLRKEPEDPDLTLARFVAELRPDLPPVYRGLDMSPAGLRGVLAPYGTVVPEGVGTVLGLLFGNRAYASPFGHVEAVLRVMAVHEGTGADGAPLRGAPSAEYEALLADFTTATRVLAAAGRRINEVLGQGWGSAVLVPMNQSDLSVRVLARLFAEDPGALPAPPSRPGTTAARWMAAFRAAAGPVQGAAAAGSAVLLENCVEPARRLAQMEDACRAERGDYARAIDRSRRVRALFLGSFGFYWMLGGSLVLVLTVSTVSAFFELDEAVLGWFVLTLFAGLLVLGGFQPLRLWANPRRRKARIDYLEQGLKAIEERLVQAEDKRRRLAA
ncbi:serine/threonine-protein kinase [Actinorugispora endophytica]|uniref:non-specific serine/threonine protein kinase n=1 Tax=Actinorugispora endophytica TaxID=1605990 RepID=A0A4R6V0S8_9ACTN|nr:serine/threonine-protein kinase [Actinorugispora endophytica]TDQ49604.1 serine/threonine protein kinase [Actinorugispora endophytica]